jgi:AraC-like DNA-binding protein
LVHDKVCAVEWARDGYLWLGTPAGLVRFDGVRFEVYNHLNTPILENSRILCLHEDRDGVLWIGTDGGGLYSYRDGEWGKVGTEDGLLSKHIRAVWEDVGGSLWVGTEYGLHRWDGDDMHVVGLDEGLADNLITSLVVGGVGRVWAGTLRGGLARIESGWADFGIGPTVFPKKLVQIYDYDDGLEDLAVLSVAVGPDGFVWIGTMSGLFYLEPDEGIVRPVAEAMGYPVTSLVMSPDSGLFVGTMVEGLKYLKDTAADSGRLEYISITDLLVGEELRYSYICDILPDEDGFIWVGTESNGLVQIKERTVNAVDAAEGLPGGAVYPLWAADDGTLWIGTEKDGLYRMRGDRLELISNRERGLAGDMVRVLMEDRSGSLWVGTMDGGLSILKGDLTQNLTTANGLASNNVTSILQDREGVVWIGTDRGLNYHKIGMIEEHGSVQSLDGQTIRTLYENVSGVLYAGTRSGVWRRSGPYFERIIADNDTTVFDVLSLYEDSTDALWMGTNGNGTKRLYNNEIMTFTTADGLPGNFIFSITEGDSGFIWMSCENGAFSVSRDSLNAYAAGTINMLTPTLYNEADGMPSSRCIGFCQPAVCESGSGKRFYPTEAGIAVLDPKEEHKPSRPPVVRIEEMLADDVPIHIDDDMNLSAGTDRIEIQFTAFDYSAPEKLRFLFRLRRNGENLAARRNDRDFTALNRAGNGKGTGFTALHPGQPRRAVYHDLPPGEYEFSVRAIGNGGIWSERAATVRFTVLPPFYRTKAFLFIIIAAAVLIAGAAMLTSRYRRLKKQRLKYSTTTISDERMEEALAGLQDLMEIEKVYLDPDLTLQKLAKQLRIHYNHLSRIINERFGVSFKNYINRYRIEEAKRRLADSAEKDRNITDIMIDAGFYSKSTFNTAFRKFTGTSPSKYRKKHL